MTIFWCCSSFLEQYKGILEKQFINNNNKKTLYGEISILMSN